MRTITGVDLPVGSPGGSVELLHDLYLAEDSPVRADVFMLAGTAPGSHGGIRSPVLLDVAGKQVDGAGFWSYVEALVAAVRVRFARGDYDVVHLQHLAFGATAALLRAFPDHPQLALVHGTDLLYAMDHPTQRTVLDEVVARSRAVVVPTAAMASLLTRLAPVDPARMHHVPWGVPDQLLAAPPAARRSPDGNLRLLYAGRLTAEKGATSLIRTVVGIEGVTLSLAAPVGEYAALAREHDLSGVDYLGWLTRADLWGAFAAHDALIVPSTRLEAFGLVAVEAQAVGLPVLYQPVPGLVEVLGDSALAVDVADSDAVAAVVATLRADPAALTDLRAAGYRNAKRFPLSVTARELRALSERVIGG